MSLFSDGSISSIDDLVQQDSALISVASVEGIDVTAKLALAYTEIAVELGAIFARSSSIYSTTEVTQLDTKHLLVTDSLKAWHCFHSLELVYRDAYFNQLNDRYKGKWSEYQSLSRWAMGKFIETGAGLITDPLPQPTSPTVTFQNSSQTGGTFYSAVTFTNAAGEESVPTGAMQVDVADGMAAVLALNLFPTNAVGWNVYGGSSPSTMTLQNESPLAPNSTWQYSLPSSQIGRPIGTGQSANGTRELPRRIMRG